MEGIHKYLLNVWGFRTSTHMNGGGSAHTIELYPTNKYKIVNLNEEYLYKYKIVKVMSKFNFSLVACLLIIN